MTDIFETDAWKYLLLGGMLTPAFVYMILTPYWLYQKRNKEISDLKTKIGELERRLQKYETPTYKLAPRTPQSCEIICSDGLSNEELLEIIERNSDASDADVVKAINDAADVADARRL